MQTKDRISASCFFKRYIGLFLIMGIMAFLVNEFLKIDQVISNFILGLLPSGNSIMSLVFASIVGVLLGLVIFAILSYLSIRSVFQDATLDYSDVNKILKYYSILYWALTIPVILIELSPLGSIQVSFTASFMDIPVWVFTAIDVTSSIISYILCILILRKFILNRIEEPAPEYADTY